MEDEDVPSCKQIVQVVSACKDRQLIGCGPRFQLSDTASAPNLKPEKGLTMKKVIATLTAGLFASAAFASAPTPAPAPAAPVAKAEVKAEAKTAVKAAAKDTKAAEPAAKPAPQAATK
ncbi:hypothetical protein [Massilia aquatica]|nr:hypothetical protein [Massilia aquatica]